MKYLCLVVCAVQAAFSWGNVGHKIINKNAVIHLPVSMKLFIDRQSFLETHSTDPDTRKTSDTAMWSEQYRHFLDVDEYPDFKNLNRDFSVLVNTFGWARVKDNGTNPWWTVIAMDSLTQQLKRMDTTAAFQTAADLGHYVADPHQPLHAANNYNGQLTGNTGIHSRYESTMIGNHQAELTFTKDSVRYISDVYGFAFDYILKSNALCDSIFHADNAGKAATGGSYTTKYYDTLWARLGAMTKNQFQAATIDLASLWYTAWVNAGLLPKPTTVKKGTSKAPRSFNLRQNFPNPFNPTTTIQFDVPHRSSVRLEIVSMDGKRVASLVNGVMEEGSYSTEWDAGALASGMYLCRLASSGQVQTRKMLFVK